MRSRKQPNRVVAGNLRFTRSGVVWADFVLSGVSYGLRPAKEKEGIRALHTALFRALAGESLLMSMCSTQDPAHLVADMIDGLDLGEHAALAAEAAATLDTLDRFGPGRRVYWLAVPLGYDQVVDRLLEPARASWSDVRDLLSLPTPSIPASVLKRRAQQAELVRRLIPAAFEPVPATAAQMMWLHAHSLQRGLGVDSPLPETAEAVVRSGAGFSAPWLDEGAKSDLGRRDVVNPLKAKVVKVAAADAVGEQVASYQTVMALEKPPPNALAFPGYELIGRIDECGVEVDWALRLHQRSGMKVRAANDRAMRHMNEQWRQRSEDIGQSMNVLTKAAQQLGAYGQELEENTSEVEVKNTLILAVGGRSADEAQQRAEAVEHWFAAAEAKLCAPVGRQEELWWQMHPGVPTTRITRELEQLQTSSDLAGLVPLASSQFGDAHGHVWGFNITTGSLLDPDVPCGPTSVVFRDQLNMSSRNVGASMAFCGEKGSGKSLAMKDLTGAIIDRGGRAIITDRSPLGEWANWAQAVTDAVVVDPGQPRWSLDPLRMFPGDDGAELAQSHLTTMLNIAPSSEQGATLSDILDSRYRAAHHLDGLGQLAAHCYESSNKDLQDIGKRMAVFARKPIGAVTFDPDLPPLDPWSSPCIVLRTHKYAMPTHDEIDKEHLFRQLSIDKVYGRSIYALHAALAKTICFADVNEHVAWVVDEFHHVTSNPEGVHYSDLFVRDDRKHNASMLVGSHNGIDDFAGMTSLCPTRVGFRNTDEDLARAEAKFLGLPDTADILEIIQKELSPVDSHDFVPVHRRGECIVRDPHGQYGLLKITAPFEPTRAHASLTTAPDDEAARAARAAAAHDRELVA